MSKKSDKPKTPEQLRAAAERKLVGATKPKPKPKPKQLPAEGLLHELQVHQIELEMQNEQLRLAQAALEESRDRYVDLYELAPVGYLTLTPEATISGINLTGATLLGIERIKLLHRRFGSFVVQKQCDRWNQLFADTLKSDGLNSCEITLEVAGDKCMQAHLDCRSLEDKDGQKTVRIAMTDITRQARAEDTLHEWQKFVEYASWGMAIGDVEGQTIRLVNPAFARMHGYTVEEMIGMKSIDLFSEACKKDFVHHLGAMIRSGHHAFECERVRKDGSAFFASVDASAVIGFDGKANYIVSVKDITDHMETGKRMRELTAHIQTVREQEKANIAREIHDDLGGTLTALKMEAYWLAEELSASSASEPLLKHVELISQLTENAVNVTRRVISGLRPTILDDLGLLAALEWQAEQFQNHTGITCRVNSIENRSKLDKQSSIALFRIFQETLTNVARHSGATKVEVEFRCGEEEVMLSVSDNGIGLPENHTVQQSSYGVRGMCERVDQLGGKIKFDSPPSGGFAVTVILPLSIDNPTESKS